MLCSVRLVGHAPTLEATDEWFASTKAEVKRLSYHSEVAVDVPENSWFEVWSYLGASPPNILKDGTRITVEIGPPPTEKARHINLLHVTDLHFEFPRLSGPVLGREDFGDVYPPIGIDRDFSLVTHLAASLVKLDGIVVTGDLTDHGTDPEYLAVRSCLDRARRPVLMIPGNHDHYGHLFSGSCRGNPDLMRTADTSRYENHIGPRWWARLLGDGIIIGLDWFSWYLDLDGREQRHWLKTLGEVIKRPRNVVLATHDEFDDRRWREVEQCLRPHSVRAVLSGHWHVSRVCGRRGYVGFSTASLACGGLHLGPPEARVIMFSRDLEVKGSRTLLGSHDKWREEGRKAEPRIVAPSSATIWSAQLFNLRMHRTTAAVRHGSILIGGAFTDRPGGTLIWLASETGATQHALQLREGCIGPLALGESSGKAICICCLADGTIAAVDWSGNLLWEAEGAHAPLRYSQTGAVIAGSLVIGGDARGVRCFSLETGETRWSSGVLGSPENLISYASPFVVDRRAIVPVGGPGAGLACFDLDSGEIQWLDDGHLGIAASGVTLSGELGFVVRSKGTLECFELATGRVAWSRFFKVDLGGPAPAVVDGKVIAVSTDGYGIVVDRAAGRLLEIFAAPLRVDRTGAYRNRSSFITGLGCWNGLLWVSYSVGAIMVSDLTKNLGVWRCLVDVGLATTSAALIMPTDAALLIGFEGRVVMSNCASTAERRSP